MFSIGDLCVTTNKHRISHYLFGKIVDLMNLLATVPCVKICHLTSLPQVHKYGSCSQSIQRISAGYVA